jgi:hypothetical protein
VDVRQHEFLMSYLGSYPGEVDMRVEVDYKVVHKQEMEFEIALHDHKSG